jgi:amino acid transporter
VVLLRRREPDLPRGFKVPGYPVTPALAIIACGYILYSLSWHTWVAFALWVSVFLTFYFVWGRHHSALNRPAALDVAGVEVIHPPRDVP